MAQAPTLVFLTGRRFWHQTAFCLHTLQRHAGCTFRVEIHDDGSLDDFHATRLRAIFPTMRIRLRQENDARIAAVLPATRYPTLQSERRHPYPNFLKLTDVHAGEAGWRLVLDSDMLFFRRPEYLLTWLAAPDRPLHLVDVNTAYGYPLEAMSRLAGATVPARINVGFCGLDSSAIDWDLLEHWARSLIDEFGTHYYLEQALSAMLVTRHGSPAAAPAGDYVVMPSEAECRAPSAVLHHYVDTSKRGYFRHAWHHAVPGPTSART